MRLFGRQDECAALDALIAGTRAGRSASLVLRGEEAHGGGWLARAERLVGDTGECVATGLVLVPRCIGALMARDADTTRTLALEMVDIARRVGDRELLVLGLLSIGQAEYLAARTELARKAFDEAMVSVTANEVSPVVAGIVYCAVIDSCMESGDLPRALVEDAPRTYMYKVGDVVYWPPGPHVAVFYRQDGRTVTAGMIRLGSVDAGVDAFAPSSSVRATIELVN